MNAAQAIQRAPMKRAKHTEPGMHLPEGKTCADCRHCDRCCAMFGHIPEDEVCDWFPSRFSAGNQPAITDPAAIRAAFERDDA